ncbi:hypothetical protein AgCh_029810 [Apium graveolens]
MDNDDRQRVWEQGNWTSMVGRYDFRLVLPMIEDDSWLDQEIEEEEDEQMKEVMRRVKLKGGLRPTTRATVEEQVVKSQVPSEIFTETRFYPYFKDCIGAIDGTHVRVKVSSAEAPKYRGRKDYPTQNILGTCTFDLKFSYVLAGWEGTASDSRIIKNALTRNHCPKIPEGKYYLVDAGFMLKSGLITPYRRVRYHLKEYSGNPPRNARELFNHRHSSLRNAIERAFGVLKKRFPIIASGTEPNYRMKTQNLIILSCFILHNYLIKKDPDHIILAEVDREIENGGTNEQLQLRDEDEDTKKGEDIRDCIAAQMWANYSL